MDTVTEGADPHSRRLLGALTELAEVDPPSESGLGRLCAGVGEMLHARGVGVAGMAGTGDPWVLAGADEQTRALLAAQFEVGEGPCVDAWRRAEPVWDRCSSAAERWPRWAPHALEARLDGVLAIPLGRNVDDRPVGTLWMAFDQPEWLDDALLHWTAAIATVVLRNMAARHEIERRDEQVAQLEHALESRVLIEQAKGFVAAREDLTPEEAFERLRRQARSSQRSLRDVAAEALRGSVVGGGNGSSARTARPRG